MASKANDAPGKSGLIRVIYAVMAMIVLAFLAGLWLLWAEISFSRNAVEVPAEIVRINYSETGTMSTMRGSNSSFKSFPTFAFVDADQVKWQVSVSAGMDSDLRLGQKLNVLYDPRAPASRIRLPDWRFWHGYGVLIVAVTSPLMAMLLYRRFQGSSEEEKKRQARNKRARDRRAEKRAARD